MRLVSRPVRLLHKHKHGHGRVRVPGDKSISHRAAMLGAVAEGVTEVTGFLNSLDCRSTLDALVALGVEIETDWNTTTGNLRIRGMSQLKAPTRPLDCGNSGTALRLLSGLLSGQPFTSVLTGDESLRERPMQRIAEPLALMGADVRTADGTPPVEIYPVRALHGIDYRSPVASAQVKSCLLLATLFAEGVTVLREDTPTRDHTERMLEAFGAPLSAVPGWVELAGRPRLKATTIRVPGDLSSAAFFIVAASLAGEGELLLENVGVNPTRTGALEILKLMGADIEVTPRPDDNRGDNSDDNHGAGEPVADLRVRSAPLHGVVIPRELVANAIDEFPVLFVAAACAEGATELHDAAELRFKESDRIQTMADGLAACGVGVETRPDGLTIHGGGIAGGRVNSRGDHRIAMAFAVAGAVSEQGVTIDDCAAIDTSFPDFVATATAAGFDLERVQ